MQKFLKSFFVILFLFVFQNFANAQNENIIIENNPSNVVEDLQDSENSNISVPAKIKFIYLHGSNCNKQKDFDKFIKQATKLHKYIIKNFNKNEIVKEKLLENNSIPIDETPNIFIWGDRSSLEINMLSDLLNVKRLFTPKLAQLARSIIAHCMHDAIWVQQYYNMAPILNDLHKEVLKEQEKGNKVVLLGYSAGSFITLKYILAYSPVINSIEFLKQYTTNLPQWVENKMLEINPDKTCLNAIMSMDSVYIKENSKGVKIHLAEKTFLEEYSKMNEKTKIACYQDQTLKGVINFGTPQFLFNSSLTNPQTEMGKYSHMVFGNYISKGHFWLSLNFKEDPLGFSDKNTYHVSKVEEQLNFDFEKDTGFIFDNSNMRANRLFATAHYAYLTRYKLFAKNIAKSFEKAYETFYQEKEE